MHSNRGILSSRKQPQSYLTGENYIEEVAAKYTLERNARVASSRLDREISVRTAIVIACCRLSVGMLQAISNATVSLRCPSRRRKFREHSIKSAWDLEKVGNRIVL